MSHTKPELPARILIVDDIETNRDALKMQLAVHSYDLPEAGAGHGR